MATATVTVPAKSKPKVGPAVQSAAVASDVKLGAVEVERGQSDERQSSSQGWPTLRVPDGSVSCAIPCSRLVVCARLGALVASAIVDVTVRVRYTETETETETGPEPSAIVEG